MKEAVKQFSINWNSLEEVTQLFNASKSRYFELRKTVGGRPSRKERFEEVVAACKAIMDCDISRVYAPIYLKDNPVYYVYAHLDARRKIATGVNPISQFAASLGMEYTPFYIGKGVGERCFEFKRSETHAKTVKAMRSLGKEPVVFKIQEGLTESEALQMEAKLIDIFGPLSNGGWLTNLDEGVNSKKRRQSYIEHLSKIRGINRPLYAEVAYTNGAG